MPRGADWLLFVALLAAGCGSEEPAAEMPAEEEQPQADAINVRVAPVLQAPISSIYSTSTTLRPEKRATVTARTRGVVRSLEVEEGDRVTRGQSLAILDNDAQCIESRRTAAALANEKREFERSEKLFQQKLQADALHETARRELEEARHAAEAADLELSRTIIRAPFAGRILRRHLDVGATVSDGSSVFDVADLSPLYADVNVPERELVRLAAGQNVRLIAEQDTTQAQIERIGPEVDPSTGTVKVTLSVAGEQELRPGAFVRVAIVTATRDQALVVPRSALVANGRRWNLFRLKEEGDVVEQLEVKLGFEEGDRVEVVGVVDKEALLAGQPVVVLGASALTDGATVQVMATRAEPELEDEPPAEESPSEPA